MGLFDIGFFIFRVIIICLIFIGVSKNILTRYGVGLFLAVLVLGVTGYDIWAALQVKEAMNQIELVPSRAEKEMITRELMRWIGTHP